MWVKKHTVVLVTVKVKQGTGLLASSLCVWALLSFCNESSELQFIQMEGIHSELSAVVIQMCLDKESEIRDPVGKSPYDACGSFVSDRHTH